MQRSESSQHFSDSWGGAKQKLQFGCTTTAAEAGDHKFLVSGHSYLPNDADFDVIEGAIKTYALGGPIFA